MCDLLPVTPPSRPMSHEVRLGGPYEAHVRRVRGVCVQCTVVRTLCTSIDSRGSQTVRLGDDSSPAVRLSGRAAGRRLQPGGKE